MIRNATVIASGAKPARVVAGLAITYPLSRPGKVETPELEDGGTLAVLLGTQAIRRGYHAKIFTYNLRVFDPSWFAHPSPATRKAGHGVDCETLDVKPIADQLLTQAAGVRSSDFDDGPIGWSNELALHVIELKTNGSVGSLLDVADRFRRSLNRIAQIAETFSARRMTMTMHAWMNPTDVFRWAVAIARRRRFQPTMHLAIGREHGRWWRSSNRWSVASACRTRPILERLAALLLRVPSRLR